MLASSPHFSYSQTAPVKGVSQAACQARAGHLVHVIQVWMADGRHVAILDQERFGQTIGIPDWNAHRYTLAAYLHLEDGSTPFKPIRTGYELALYNKIKDFIANRPAGARLGPDELLRMGLDVCSSQKNGIANLQVTFLTVHNVVRLLARQEHWFGDFPNNRRGTREVGHPPDDPVYPILQDILGLRSTGGEALPDILHIRHEKSGKTLLDKLRPALFGLKDGPFQPEPGAQNAGPGSPDEVRTREQAIWNGGCHYYFWVGAVAQSTLGAAAVMGGIRGESKGKEGGTEQEGAVQLTHFVCGSIFASEVIKNRDKFLH